jgi:pectate lyase
MEPKMWGRLCSDRFVKFIAVGRTGFVVSLVTMTLFPKLTNVRGWQASAMILQTPHVPHVPAFPGAQGGGAWSVGGRGGAVYEVTNLNDSGPGSLRVCINASGPRTCVFRTGGHLTLHSQLYIGKPYLTIAGQTAPGGGIELSSKEPNGTAHFTEDMVRIETHDVIIRYVKFRLGHIAGANYANALAIQARSQYNIMIDHCSIYWGAWDDITVWAANAGLNKNITFSWNIIAEPLLQPGATGTVAASVSGANSKIADASTNIDFHHNVFASSDHRTPLHTVRSGRLVNNVVYNWNYYAFRTKGSKDIIGNYFKPGPLNPSPRHEIHGWTTNDGNDTSYAPSLYVTANAGPHNSYSPSTDNWTNLTALAGNESAGEASSPLSTAYQRTTPLATSGVAITVESATSLAVTGGSFLTTVGTSQKLNDAACDGTFISNRDSVDARVVNEFLHGTGTLNSALQFESQVGGFPTLAAGTPCTDSDHDGIPDVWETAHGLNPNNASDGAAVAANGYTNLENYLSGNPPTTPRSALTPPVFAALAAGSTGLKINSAAAASPVPGPSSLPRSLWVRQTSFAPSVAAPSPRGMGMNPGGHKVYLRQNCPASRLRFDEETVSPKWFVAAMW